jgi:hypothetical protein
MTQYLLLIHDNAKRRATPDEWERFFAAVRASGMFLGGSALGERVVVGDGSSGQPSRHIVGYMRFDSDDRSKRLQLLERHPVVLNGGSVELCEIPKS